MTAPTPAAKPEVRKLHQIASDIINSWESNRPSPAVMNYSGPYLEAMAAMDYVEDRYGMESGDMVVLYFLNNVTNWRGEDARRIKAELNQMVKDYNNGVRYRNV